MSYLARKPHGIPQNEIFFSLKVAEKRNIQHSLWLLKLCDSRQKELQTGQSGDCRHEEKAVSKPISGTEPMTFRLQASSPTSNLWATTDLKIFAQFLAILDVKLALTQPTVYDLVASTNKKTHCKQC